jgi:hypothetical protein
LLLTDTLPLQSSRKFCYKICRFTIILSFILLWRYSRLLSWQYFCSRSFIADESVLHICNSRMASLKMRPIFYLETSVLNYPVTRCHSQGERSSQLLEVIWFFCATLFLKHKSIYGVFWNTMVKLRKLIPYPADAKNMVSS